jgi:hypothetical protein
MKDYSDHGKSAPPILGFGMSGLFHAEAALTPSIIFRMGVPNNRSRDRAEYIIRVPNGNRTQPTSLQSYTSS